MNEMDALKKLLTDNVVGYHPAYARIGGGVNAGILLAQILYWTRYSKDGWVFRSQQAIERETALSIPEQNTARRCLRARGLVTEDRRGIPYRLYYLPNWDAIRDAIAALPDPEEEPSSQQASCPASNNQHDQPATTSMSTHENYHENYHEIVDAVASTPTPEREPSEALAPTSAEAQQLFSKLRDNASAKGRRGPVRFPSLECKHRFDAAVEVLGPSYDRALSAALTQGITKVVGVVNYLGKWADNKQAPTIIRVRV